MFSLAKWFRTCIVLNFLFTAGCVNSISYPTATSRPPTPLPTARPVINQIASNASVIADAFPAIFTFDYDTEYSLNQDPEIFINENNTEVRASYSYGLNYLEMVIQIYPSVSDAKEVFDGIRTAPEWISSSFGDEGLVSDSFGLVRYTNIILYVRQGLGGAVDADIRKILARLVNIIESPNLIVAQRPSPVPTSTLQVAPFGSAVASPTPTLETKNPDEALSKSEDIFGNILSFLRDQAWAGIGVIVAIILWILDRRRK